MKTEFKPETHQYFVDGKEVPSVTKICRSLFCKDRQYDPFYAERGTAVHKACELLDKGVLDESSLDPEIIGYVSAYRKFTKEVKPKWEQIEVPCYTEMVCGTPDRVGEILGSKCILDIKTGSPEKWHTDQLSGYSAFFDPTEYKTWYALYLKKTGTYKLEKLQCDPMYFFCYVHTYERMKDLGVL